MNTQSTVEPIIRLHEISRHFPGVQALDRVSFEIAPGEVHAVVGENGAGKSTLMNLLAGVLQPSSGTILWKGQPISIRDPHTALAHGICAVYQESSLAPNMSIAANLCLGREPATSSGLLDWPRMYEQAQAPLAALGLDLDPGLPVAALDVAQRQLVEIARAIAIKAEVIILDEPNTALTGEETARLFRALGQLKAAGVTLIYVSHRLEEVFSIADRVTVLRDGRWIVTCNIADTTIPEVVHHMVGRQLATAQRAVRPSTAAAKVALSVVDLERKGAFKHISFDLHAGEVLGIAGLAGAGHPELLRCIFGLDQPDAGRILVAGRPTKLRSPSDAIRAGLGFVPSDRRNEGALIGMDVKANIATLCLPQLQRGGLLEGRAIRQLAHRLVQQLDVRLESIDQSMAKLSGGNQQKIIFARWLAAGPQVLLLDEPTQGIDVGAKAEIFRILHGLAQGGLGVLMIASELPELMNECDRILVMYHGQISGVFAREQFSAEAIMACATGVGRNVAGQEVFA